MENLQQNPIINNSRSSYESSSLSGSNLNNDPLNPMNVATSSPLTRDSQIASALGSEDSIFAQGGSGKKMILYTLSEDGELQPYEFIENVPSHSNIIRSLK